VLFTLGGAFALYEGIEKLRHPHEVDSLWWAVGILAVAVVLEGSSFRTARREAAEVRGDAGWVAFIRRAKSPELPVVLLEDLGALVGLAFALGGVLLAHATGNPRFDAAGSIAIGLLLGTIATVLAVEMKGLLIGEGASPERLELIADEIAAAPSVARLIHLRTEHLGPDELLVAAKVEFARHLDVAALARAIDEVERRVRGAVPEARLIYLEPDIARADAAT
jgi:divalent metal cation (Fe/Co/Zn/Cd) transporter